MNIDAGLPLASFSVLIVCLIISFLGHHLFPQLRSRFCGLFAIVVALLVFDRVTCKLFHSEHVAKTSMVSVEDRPIVSLSQR